jgi:hypothetical protein
MVGFYGPTTLIVEKEFIKLNNVISALLTIHPAKSLSSPVARARALGEPFDPAKST